MIFRRFAPGSRSSSIAALYGAIVAQVRAPAFYRSFGVPDTVSGRLEMLMLHIVLVLRRLEDGTAKSRRLGQDLFDHFCGDMDATMREMGIGDLAVPRKMRRIGEAFYGRQGAYRAALAAADPNELVLALRRNIFGRNVCAGGDNADNAALLAAYSREAARELARQEGFARSEIIFPDPEGLLVKAAADHE